MRKIYATFVSILLILTFSVNVPAKDFDTPEIPFYPNSYVAGITPKSTAGIDNEKSLIYGIEPNLTDLSQYIDIIKAGVTLNYSTSTIGTGTKVYIMQDGSVIGTFEAVIFGDIDGDSAYNGIDAVIVNCIANGMLTKEQVGTAQYTAADCNHDGVIDRLDVDVLVQSGLLLSEVSQTQVK